MVITDKLGSNRAALKSLAPMTPHGHIANPLDIAANSESLLEAALSRLSI